MTEAEGEPTIDQHQKRVQHAKEWGPMYTLIIFLAGGGSLAAISDNIPVTNKQFLAWTQEHTAGMHTGAETAVNELKGTLDAIRLEQTREQLKKAYADKCLATDDASIEYIDREIDRLETIYFGLTGREYDPPPCAN